eukprot:Clim_evm20s88 gene=Clim_evmTU20s88
MLKYFNVHYVQHETLQDISKELAAGKVSLIKLLIMSTEKTKPWEHPSLSMQAKLALYRAHQKGGETELKRVMTNLGLDKENLAQPVPPKDVESMSTQGKHFDRQPETKKRKFGEIVFKNHQDTKAIAVEKTAIRRSPEVQPQAPQLGTQPKLDLIAACVQTNASEGPAETFDDNDIEFEKPLVMSSPSIETVDKSAEIMDELKQLREDMRSMSMAQSTTQTLRQEDQLLLKELKNALKETIEENSELRNIIADMKTKYAMSSAEMKTTIDTLQTEMNTSMESLTLQQKELHETVSKTTYREHTKESKDKACQAFFGTRNDSHLMLQLKKQGVEMDLMGQKMAEVQKDNVALQQANIKMHNVVSKLEEERDYWKDMFENTMNNFEKNLMDTHSLYQAKVKDLEAKLKKQNS